MHTSQTIFLLKGRILEVVRVKFLFDALLAKFLMNFDTSTAAGRYHCKLGQGHKSFFQKYLKEHHINFQPFTVKFPSLRTSYFCPYSKLYMTR